MIRQTVQTYLPGSRILLFGSRARGDQNNYSDYDLLIITSETLSAQEKIQCSTKIDHAIVKAIRIPVDILLNSQEEIEQKVKLPGHIIRSALKEGVTL